MGGELPTESRAQQAPGGPGGAGEELLVLQGTEEYRGSEAVASHPSHHLHLLAPPPTWGLELSRLNHRTEAQATESWFILEIITTGRVSTWGRDRSHKVGCGVSSCRHLVGARGNTPPSEASA